MAGKSDHIPRIAARPAALAAALLAVASVPGPSTAETTARPATALPAVPPSGEMGFIVRSMVPGRHRVTAQDCPDGWAGDIYQNYVASLPEPERSEMAKKENEEKMRANAMRYAAGPNNTNICGQPDTFNRSAHSTLQGRLGIGLNLDGAGDDASDGARDSYTCAHKNFTSPAGETGIDNQMWRALGCLAAERQAGNENADGLIADDLSTFANGEWSEVILVRGIDSLVKDDNVEVVFGNTDDKPILSSTGVFIRNASYQVTEQEWHRAVLRGRIVNGVLTTDPVHLLLRKTTGAVASEIASRGNFDLDRGRLRLTFKADGTLSGLLGGYEPVKAPLTLYRLGGIRTVEALGVDCAAQYYAAVKMADGARDPVTGRCSRVSSAYVIDAIPAFVRDRPPAARSAGR